MQKAKGLECNRAVKIANTYLTRDDAVREDGKVNEIS